jgi:pre-mRNA-splicing factor SYF1
MPRIWLDYCQFLMDQCKITRTRRVFDRAIRALPITQHNRIWLLYIKFVTSYPEIPDTATRVYKRYLQVRDKEKGKQDFGSRLLAAEGEGAVRVRSVSEVKQYPFGSG